MSDPIDRQTAIEKWKNDFKGYVNALNIPRDDYNGIMEYINELPSAQPEFDEWCTDCKEYDQERHCCPRWNKVIRQTLKDVQPESCEDVKFWRKRAEYYSKMCFDLIADINKGVKIDSVEINEDGIKFTKKQQEPCEDAVSKIKDASFIGSDGLDYVETLVALDALKLANSSSAQPKQKKGKWIKIVGYCTPGGDPVWCCSECGKGIHVYGIEHGTYGTDIADQQWVACPNCGAVMEE